MNIDNKLLMILQYNFPISKRPFKEIGNDIGLKEDEVIRIIKTFSSMNIIKRISLHMEPMILDDRVRALIGFKVDRANIEKIAITVNKLKGLKHNYLRDDDKYNIWFTLKRSSKDDIEDEVKKFLGSGIISDYVILYTKKIYKLDVRYDLYKGISWSPPVVSEPDIDAFKKLDINRDLLKELIKGIIITERPFKIYTEKYGISEDSLIENILYLRKHRIIRYFGATLNSEEIGFSENAMIVFKSRENNINNIFIKLVKDIPEATHCIERKPDKVKWDFHGYIMIHSRDREYIKPIIDKVTEYDEITKYKVVYSEKNLGGY